MPSFVLTYNVEVSPTPPFGVEIDEGIIEQYLQTWADDIKEYFISNMGGSPSPPGAYPGILSGQLSGSVEATAGGRDGSVTASTPYVGYLVSGTSKMAPRKMVREACEETPQPDPSELAEAVSFT